MICIPEMAPSKVELQCRIGVYVALTRNIGKLQNELG